MKNLLYNELEIIGFNGDILTSYGRSLVIVLHSPTGRCFQFTDQENIPFYTLNEIKLFQEQKRLTLFQKSFPMLQGARAIYVTEKFVQSIGFKIPSDFIPDLLWQELSETEEKTWATVADADFVEKQINKWRKLKELQKVLV